MWPRFAGANEAEVSADVLALFKHPHLTNQSLRGRGSPPAYHGIALHLGFTVMSRLLVCAHAQPGQVDDLHHHRFTRQGISLDPVQCYEAKERGGLYLQLMSHLGFQ